MKSYFRILAGFAVIGLGMALWATSPGASSERFIVTNDAHPLGFHNTGTVMKLGPLSNPSLTVTNTLRTGGLGAGSAIIGQNQEAIIRHGNDVCVFLSDPETGDIASFLYPAFTEVGRYTFPGINNSDYGLGLAVRDQYLYASYGDSTDNGFYLGVWQIKSGCTLTLVNTFQAISGVDGMAATPDNKTLVVGYRDLPSAVDSFSIGPDGALTEHGPYYAAFLESTGVDITADGKYAVIGEIGLETPYTQLGIWVINSDGTLGHDWDTGAGGLGAGLDAGWVRLSPDEKFIFVSDVANDSQQVTTVGFDEATHSVSYSGCIITPGGYPGGFGTVLRSGSGDYLYLAEAESFGGGVGMFSIDSSTGCLTEVPGSPFHTGQRPSPLASLAAWPPRPF
jgi:hypothetical protein